jgi:hypothetical protein
MAALAFCSQSESEGIALHFSLSLSLFGLLFIFFFVTIIRENTEDFEATFFSFPWCFLRNTKEKKENVV